MTDHDIAIHASKLTKSYRLGQGLAHDTLRDVLAEGLRSPGKWFRPRRQRAPSHPVIHALEDVSFSVPRGQIVGLIGSNGAGKSTILRILSRITKPTRGFVDINGRVGSLLDVGTGFHNELTGRENIYLNGAILGMTRAEIRSRFEEIVEFSGVAQFLDTPVKRYSSGMEVRLAFAVAAHLRPEILLVDEVLTVGDLEFQRKCLDRMSSMSSSGRTIVFVSHDLQAVTRLCDRVLRIGGGKVLDDGPAREVVARYIQEVSKVPCEREWSEPAQAPGGAVARLRTVSLRADGQNVLGGVNVKQDLIVRMEYEVLQQGVVLLPYFHLFNEHGVELFWSHDLDKQWGGMPRAVGTYCSDAVIPGNLLAEGRYFVAVGCEIAYVGTTEYYVENAVSFQVHDDIDGDTARGHWGGRMECLIRPLLEWNTTLKSGR